MVAHDIRLSYRENWKDPKLKEIRILKEPMINDSKLWGLFYDC
jgi:hypothetical protein